MTVKAGCLPKKLGMKHGDVFFLLPLRHKVNKPESLNQLGGVISDSREQPGGTMVIVEGSDRTLNVVLVNRFLCGMVTFTWSGGNDSLVSAAVLFSRVFWTLWAPSVRQDKHDSHPYVLV